jgi:hypothetical protein
MSLAACRPQDDPNTFKRNRINFEVLTNVRSKSLTEISGIEVGRGPRFIVHNDDGHPDLWVVDASGEIVRQLRINGARNRDWEDITRIEHGGQSLLAIGDIGDNLGRRSSIQVYFIEWPTPEAPLAINLVHRLELSYPDGPRDCEAMAYDPASERLLFLTKRDKPPRLYGVEISQALRESNLQLEFLATAPTFRPPTHGDMKRWGEDGVWVSRPTGMDIDSAGKLAAVITYRSLYLFQRQPGQSWEEAFQNSPREFHGPASLDEEAIAFGPDNEALFISSEGYSAPIYRVLLPEPAQAAQ